MRSSKILQTHSLKSDPEISKLKRSQEKVPWYTIGPAIGTCLAIKKKKKCPRGAEGKKK
jgi:hypothetical protein